MSHDKVIMEMLQFLLGTSPHSAYISMYIATDKIIIVSSPIYVRYSFNSEYRYKYRQRHLFEKKMPMSYLAIDLKSNLSPRQKT